MMNILLVEDELVVRTGMKTMIGWDEHGFRLAAEASHGGEALEVLRRLPIDIVITDIRMPVMDGLSFIEQARAGHYSCDFVVLSSYDEFDYVKKAMQLGVRDFIHKPTMEPDELMTALLKLTRERDERRAAAEAGLFFCVVRFRDIVAEADDGRMYTDDQLLAAYQSRYARQSGKQIFHSKRGGDWLLLAPPGEEAAMLSCLRGLELELGITMAWEMTSSPRAMAELDAICRELSAAVDARSEGWHRRPRYSAHIEEALSYIHDNYMNSLTLDVVSAVVHISPAYFSRLFYKETGMSFIDYLTSCRLNQAKLLLTFSPLRTYEIAHQTGYANVKYFNKLFKQKTGMTPGDFRKAAK